jgi:hypothetical protein
MLAVVLRIKENMHSSALQRQLEVVICYFNIVLFCHKNGSSQIKYCFGKGQYSIQQSNTKRKRMQ